MSQQLDKPNGWLRLVAMMLRPLLTIATAPRWEGQQHVPASGGVILVCNHISYADPLVIGHFVYDLPRVPRFLAKAGLFTTPLVGFLLRKCRQIPVWRHTSHAADSLDSAIEAIKSGGAVVIYPEGTRTQDPQLWPMRGKTGAARLALASGAPVIPIAQWGAQKIHHRFTGKIRVWRVPVRVAARSPIDLSAFAGKPITADLLTEATEIIMRRLRTEVAVLRDEPAPNSPLYQPERGSERGRA